MFRLGLGLALIVLVGSQAAPPRGQALAQEPRPPCAGEPVPAFAPVEAPPNILVNSDSSEIADWQPPECMGWEDKQPFLLVALAGAFAAEDTDVVVSRLADISAFGQTRYWSTSRETWRPLFEDLAALSAPEEGSRRDDFIPEDFVEGAKLHLWFNDSDPLSGVVDELHVVARSPERLVVDLTNLTPATALGMTAIPTGGLQTRISVMPVGEGALGLYVLTRGVSNVPDFVLPGDDSYVNRTAAIWRYLAGVPDDLEPPLAP